MTEKQSELPDGESLDEMKNRLNRETAKISWEELQRFYAGGNLIAVEKSADLLEVAIALHRDELDKFQQWLTKGTVFKVTDEQALVWFEEKSTHWAVVVAPFVLVQETASEEAKE